MIPDSHEQQLTHDDPIVQVLPYKGWRKALADYMLNSHLTCAPVTQMREVDATELVDLRQLLREKLTAEHGIHISYTHILTKIVAQALMLHNALNSSLAGEEIRIYRDVNIAIAVALPNGGLLAPVIRQANKKTIVQIVKETTELVEKVRAKQFSLDCLSGGTFTITNAGMYGTDFVTPLINLPQAAALGIGRLVQKPAVLNNEIVIRTKMGLSLTYDHRVLSGAVAAGFLQTLETLIAHPTDVEFGVKVRETQETKSNDRS